MSIESEESANASVSERPALPSSPYLKRIAATAEEYGRRRQSPRTARAYASDWRAFEDWCGRRGLEAKDGDPRVVGLYLSASASGDGVAKASVATIERRLAAITAVFRAADLKFSREHPEISHVLAGIRRTHKRPPRQKAAVNAQELLSMCAALGYDLRGLRDRAILLLGFAGGLRRSEIVGLDCGPDQTADSGGWIEQHDEGLLLVVRGKTGWREVEIARGSSERSCPIISLKTWLSFAKITHGPIFRGISGRKNINADRLGDRHVARLVKTKAMAAGLKADLSEKDRPALYAGHSLRAGLATSAAVSEADVQRHLGHASAEMTRRYKRAAYRFRVNITRAAGL